jgi:hypothetical protein
MCIGHSPHRQLAVPTVTDLSCGERALLAVIRLWFRGDPNTTASLAPIRDQLRRGGIADATLLPLFTFLGVLSQTLCVRPDIHCAECAKIGADEEALLAVFASHQHRNPDAAVTILGRWLNPVTRRQCSEAAADVAACLSRSTPPILLRPPVAIPSLPFEDDLSEAAD